ncbi:hypothetical protein ACG873_23810 [Mesorhizobium sp. AaZ16]|uniref:hypothetical protein n=1 Tax=Mesorhizobium sp. AaZ16 TaxID=3402289 RepID=UPI00374F97E9
MRTTALALAAILALSGTAAANDFAATLHYPEAASRTQAERKSLDYSATHSIMRRDISRSAAPRSHKEEAPTAESQRSGIEINPWIVPSFH